MKIKRQKQAKKIISFYKYNFNFRAPFQILLDGTFCQAALKNKIQIKEQMPKYLMGEVQLCTTNCVLKELESLGKELYGAKIILQRFQMRNCTHVKNPIPASQCLLSMLDVNNPHHYFIASQDHELSTAIKKVPGVPLLYIILNTIVLDKPSACSTAHIQAAQLGEVVTSQEQLSICKLKEEQGISGGGAKGGIRKRKRKVGNPNPLSCLKKKKKPGVLKPKATDEEKKKKRNRNKRRKMAGAEGPNRTTQVDVS